MGRKKKEDGDSTLTPLELELMTVLWKTGGATVHEVTSQLPTEYAYTTVSTVLRILLQKGFVTAEANGRQHIYVPVLGKEEFESQTLKHLVSTVFDGEPASLMRRLLDDKALTKKEVDEIRDLLEKRGGRK